MVALLPPCDVLGGMEMRGIPLVAVMSQLTGLPAVFVRKEAKQYGTRKVAEGQSVNDARVVGVEDVVTTAGALVNGCGALVKQEPSSIRLYVRSTASRAGHRISRRTASRSCPCCAGDTSARCRYLLHHCDTVSRWSFDPSICGTPCPSSPLSGRPTRQSAAAGGRRARIASLWPRRVVR
ncbi:MAG: orotate phosphoribosyltransferase [Geodermatophilaceae bacterium]